MELDRCVVGTKMQVVFKMTIIYIYMSSGALNRTLTQPVICEVLVILPPSTKLLTC